MIQPGNIPRAVGDLVTVKPGRPGALGDYALRSLTVQEVLPANGDGIYAYWAVLPNGGRWFLTDDDLVPRRTYTLDELLVP